MDFKNSDRRATLSPAVFKQLYAIHQARGLEDFEEDWKETLAHVVHTTYISEVVRTGAISRLNPFPNDVPNPQSSDEPKQEKPKGKPSLPKGLNLGSKS